MKPWLHSLFATQLDSNDALFAKNFEPEPAFPIEARMMTILQSYFDRSSGRVAATQSYRETKFTFFESLFQQEQDDMLDPTPIPKGWKHNQREQLYRCELDIIIF